MKKLLNEWKKHLKKINEASGKSEQKPPEDQIRDLATELESALLALEKEGKIDGGMKEKATAIIDLINVHFSKGTKTPDEAIKKAHAEWDPIGGMGGYAIDDYPGR